MFPTPSAALRQKCPQAFVILGACGTPVEVRTHPRNREVGVPAATLELDVAIELLKTLLAAQLGLGRAEQPGYELPAIRV
jgi:hypothetical protein